MGWKRKSSKSALLIPHVFSAYKTNLCFHPDCREVIWPFYSHAVWQFMKTGGVYIAASLKNKKEMGYDMRPQYVAAWP